MFFVWLENVLYNKISASLFVVVQCFLLWFSDISVILLGDCVTSNSCYCPLLAADHFKHKSGSDSIFILVQHFNFNYKAELNVLKWSNAC